MSTHTGLPIQAYTNPMPLQAYTNSSYFYSSEKGRVNVLQCDGVNAYFFIVLPYWVKGNRLKEKKTHFDESYNTQPEWRRQFTVASNHITVYQTVDIYYRV